MNFWKKKPMPRFNILVKLLLPLFGLLLLISTSGFSQYPGYTQVADLTNFKKQFAIQSAKIESITSDFTQEKTLTALTEKITSTGNFWFKKSNKVRLEYKSPFVYLLIMNNDKML